MSTSDTEVAAPDTAALEQRISELEHELRIQRGHANYYKDLTRYFVALDTQRPRITSRPTFADIATPLPEDKKSWIDQAKVDESKLSPDLLHYRQHGFVIKRGLIEPEVCDRYWSERMRIEDPDFSVWGGSYMDMKSMRAIALHAGLFSTIEAIIGESSTLFLSLSGTRTTSRDWHQDFYLKMGYENVRYVACWVALDDISIEMGPFEFVPGSHTLPVIRRELVWQYLPNERRDHPAWPRESQGFVSDAIGSYIDEHQMKTEVFLAKKGDVLFWHPALFHRGARATKKIDRPGVIFHYNASRVLLQTGKKITSWGGGRYVERHDRASTVKKRFS